MANVQHSALTDTDGIHEPKGISTASSNQVYVANGSSSGSWKNLSNIPGSGWGHYTNTTYTSTTYFQLNNTAQTIPFDLKSVETNLPVTFNGVDSTLMTLGTDTLLFVSTGDLMAITLSFELVSLSGSQAYLDISLYGSSDGTTYGTLLAEKSVPLLKTNQFISETSLVYVTANMASHGAKIKCSLPSGTGNIRNISLISSRIHRAR
jgi:hypothetical protein